MTTETRNYLQNRDVLRNIHLSKASYTWYIDGTWKDTKYLDYDVIFCDEATFKESKAKLVLQKINKKLLDKGKRRISALKEQYLELLNDEDYADIDNRIILFENHLDNKDLVDRAKLGRYNRLLYEAGKKRVSEITDDIRNEIDINDVVIRVFTFRHIPNNPQKAVEKCKKEAELHDKVNFPPYEHWAFHEGQLQCVAKSHHTDAGEFSTTHGGINDGLARAFITLCTRYSSRYNWRGYSYCEDMRAQAIFQLTLIGLQFNELFSSNPFSYYTSSIKHAFTAVFNQEKNAQDIRDDLLVDNNQSPSWTRQLETDLSRTEHWDKVLDNHNMDSGDVKDFDDEDIDNFDVNDEETEVTGFEEEELETDVEENHSY